MLSLRRNELPAPSCRPSDQKSTTVSRGCTIVGCCCCCPTCGMLPRQTQSHLLSPPSCSANAAARAAAQRDLFFTATSFPRRPLFHGDLFSTATSFPRRPLFHGDLFSTATSFPRAPWLRIHSADGVITISNNSIVIFGKMQRARGGQREATVFLSELSMLFSANPTQPTARRLKMMLTNILV
jgi:hypothetical protein